MPTYEDYLKNLLAVSEKFKSRLPAPGVRQELQRRTLVRDEKVSSAAQKFQEHLYDLDIQANKAEDAKEQAILDARLGAAKEHQQHENRLREASTKNTLELRQFAIERMMKKGEIDASLRNKEALTQLHEAQRQKIVAEPLAKKWESLIRQREETQKQKNRMAAETSKQQFTVNFEVFKQQNREKVKRIEFERQKQLEGVRLLGKKIPQAVESTYEQLDRLRATEAVTTVGDVAKFWYGKGKTGEELEALVKGEMRGAQIDYETVLDEVGFFGTDKQKAWESLYRMPLNADQAEPETNNIIKQFGNLVEAELQLKRDVKRNEALGMTAAQVQKEEAIMLDRMQKAFPEQSSIYHQISPNFPETAPGEFPPVEIVPERFKQLFDRVKVSAEEQGEVTKFLQREVQQLIQKRTQWRERLHELGEPQ